MAPAHVDFILVEQSATDGGSRRSRTDDERDAHPPSLALHTPVGLDAAALASDFTVVDAVRIACVVGSAAVAQSAPNPSCTPFSTTPKTTLESTAAPTMTNDSGDLMAASEPTGTSFVYFDCDTGVDDSLALGYLLRSADVPLVGIGTVSGNVAAAQAADNTLRLLDLAGAPDIPVAVGSPGPLVGEFGGGAAHVHGQNGIGDTDLPPATRAPDAETAAELLIRLSREHEGALDIIAVGPLTNLAVALQIDPDLVARIRNVTIMGGAARVPGNVSAVAEANIGGDPEAAEIVINAGWDVTLVPLDVTLEDEFSESDRQQLLDSSDPFVNALGEILDFYFDFHVPIYGHRASAMHDALAAGIAIRGIEATDCPAVPITVDTTTGPGRGQTICDLRTQRFGPSDVSGCRTRVVLKTAEPFAPLLLRRLGVGILPPADDAHLDEGGFDGVASCPGGERSRR